MKIHPITLTLLNIFLLSIGVLAQTQGDLNIEAQANFAAADKQLTQLCEKLRARLDLTGRDKLAKAQKAWAAYREAQAALEASQVRGGTAAQSVLNETRAELTRKQIERMQRILSVE